MPLGLVAPNGAVTVPAGATVNLAADTALVLCQVLSYRERQDFMAQPVRNKREIFWKGFAENIRFDTNSPNPLLVRRIVFSTPYRIELAGPVNDNTTQPTRVVSNGKHYIGLGNGPKNVDMLELLLAGKNQQDWNDPMTAKVDTSRVKVHSDRTLNIRSGNTGDAYRQFKFYDRINRKMVYDDEENANTVDPSGWAATAYGGNLQNIYCAYILLNLGSLNMNPNIYQMRTAYWHEK